VSDRPRIGVYGGQFDPPHAAHVAVARAAVEQLRLDRLVIVPAGSPPHRVQPQAGAEERLAMARAAFAGVPGAEVSRMELDRPGPSYTADTLAALAPAGELHLVLGADQLADLDAWHEPGRVRELAAIAVAPRPGITVPDGVPVLRMAPVDLSSSGVRAALRGGADPASVLPAEVAAIVVSAGLYRQGEC
jgi:nicotinate-nucleotide adenylyltransferase